MYRRPVHDNGSLIMADLRWPPVVRRRSYIAIAAFALVVLVSCGPEDGRAVGGGLGADLGNHAEDVPRSKVFVPGSRGTENAQP